MTLNMGEIFLKLIYYMPKNNLCRILWQTVKADMDAVGLYKEHANKVLLFQTPL